MLLRVPLLSFLVASCLAQDMPRLRPVPVTTGLVRPTSITAIRDGNARLWITEQPGVIRIVTNGEVSPDPFLDLRDRVLEIDPECCEERGLLGLAFPPDFQQNPRVYVNYTNRDGFSVTSRFDASADGLTADPSSESVLLKILWNSSNHNGGQLAFGPDGALYLSLGDAVASENAQDPKSLKGKILRVDVSGDDPTPQVFTMGLRNPWRFSFDRATGDLYIGDVGADSWEEVNFQPAGLAGTNFGWPVREGLSCFDASQCSSEGYTPPVASFPHADGCAVTGGYVYRGQQIPALQGTYLYADFCTGRIWSLIRDQDQWSNRLELDLGFTISTFGEDEDGEIYFTDYLKGAIFRLSDLAQPATLPYIEKVRE